jgi:hypothetical protein
VDARLGLLPGEHGQPAVVVVARAVGVVTRIRIR